MFCCPAAPGPEQTQTDDTEATEDTEEDNPEDPRSHTYTFIVKLACVHQCVMENKNAYHIIRRNAYKQFK